MKKMDRILSAILLATLCLAGCVKHNELTPGPSNKADASAQTDLVVTPAGLMPRSHVHFIGNGYRLARKNGHILKMKIGTSAVVEDFGTFTRTAGGKMSTVITQGTHPSDNPGTTKPAGGNPGWVTFAQWTNTSTSPITSITANWIVPAIPASDDGQTIFFFNAVMVDAGSDIMQPVLQYGSSAVGNTGGWAIANWYLWTNSQGYLEYGVSALTAVSPGTNLQGVITMVGQDPDGSYHYTSSFTGYGNSLDIAEGDVYNTGSTADAIDQQTVATITLETYQPGGPGVPQPSDYPAGQNFIDFTNIGATLGGSPASSSWIVNNNNPVFGESTVVIIDNTFLPSFPPRQPTNIPGQIRIYYHPAPLIDNTSRIGLSTSAPTNSTITGYPGGQVYVMLEATATASTTSTTTTTITTPGVTFTDGTTTYSVTRSNSVGTSQAVRSFIMPSSGSITITSSTVSNNPTGPFFHLPPGEVAVY
jgi:hypothetical protein